MAIPKNETVRERYKRWWEGKYCRLAGYPDAKFKAVLTARVYGPPSGFVGTVVLEYLDGTKDYVIPSKTDAFKPRKMDVEVEEGQNE